MDNKTCKCKDFPCIWLCKHLAAVVHFFRGADLGPQSPAKAGASEPMPVILTQQDGNVGSNTDDSATESFDSVANEIITLTQELKVNVRHDPGNTKSLNSIQSRLRVLVRSITVTSDGFHLPEIENIGPNQLSWPETAMQMGVKRCGKGKVDSVLTAKHIGEPNCKHVADGDLYGMEEQSGKCAKLDACSAAANAQAYMAKEQPAPKVPLPSSSQPLPTPLPPPMSQPMLFPPRASFPSLYMPNLPYYHYHY